MGDQIDTCFLLEIRSVKEFVKRTLAVRGFPEILFVVYKPDFMDEFEKERYNEIS